MKPLAANSVDNLENELKTLIVECLQLEDISVEEIETDAPLFGDGLGLDSIDALEIGMAIQKRYSVVFDAQSQDMQNNFASIRNLAAFVASART